MNSEINFEFGEGTGSFASCSAVLEGKMMIFGGSSSTYNGQISQVIGCRLERVGQFPGSVWYPACNTFGSSPNQRVWICFNEENKSKCKRFHSQEIVTNLTYFKALMELRSSTSRMLTTHISTRHWPNTKRVRSLSDHAFHPI